MREKLEHDTARPLGEVWLELDLDAVLAAIDASDAMALTRPLRDAAKSADADGDNLTASALHLLADICTIHFRPDDRAEPFGPLIDFGAQRSCTASDLRGEHTKAMALLAPSVANSVLRARLADLAWYNDRGDGSSGRLACNSYCEIIEARLSGALSRSHGLDDRIFDLVGYMHRAFQIAYRVYRQNDLPPKLLQTFTMLVEAAAQTGQYVALVELCEFGRGYKVIDWSDVLTRSNEALGVETTEDYPMARKAVCELAANAGLQLGDKKAAAKHQREAVNMDLAMMRQVGGSKLAQAHWLRVAIGDLRKFGGFADWLDELRAELRDLEEGSLDEFVGHSYRLDVGDDALATFEVFDKLPLADALLQLALLNQPYPEAELRKQADESAQKYPMSNLFGGTHTDRDGKVVAQTNAAPTVGEPDGDWYKAQSLLFMDMHRQTIVAGRIDPARSAVLQRFPLEQRHFVPIVRCSPFVQEGYEHLYSLGFARFWQGDLISASHILIPQLENSIRYVLKNADAETSKLMQDLTQDDLSLSGLFLRARWEMDRVFGSDLVHEVDLLFNFRPGPKLRHETAHGKLSDGHCFSHSTAYGCWLIYFMTCLPLISHWDDKVSPLIEEVV